MTDEHPTGAELATVGQRVGGWVIHVPAVVCTSSPHTVKSADATVGPAAYRHRPHLSLARR
jgi:hypothetical protein